MEKTLQDYFPMIHTRTEVLTEIENSPYFREMFESQTDEMQETFLDICTGIKGVKILFDPFFKEIFNPEYHPERVEKFISLILQQEVKIKQLLPNDTVRIADECTLLITDIILELEDGSLVNVEIQKIGYAFPGERMACYSADMLLRQYKRVKARRKKKFTYRDIKNVYLIVLFEKSIQEFKMIPEEYIHRGETQFNTGLQLNTLQKYILIPLDIFKQSKHNESNKNELDAWLSFLSYDEPEKIMELIETHPEFKDMYEEIYRLCANIERMMDMFFSEELRELDRNTVQYMIEEQEKEIEENKKIIEASKKEIEASKKEIEASKKEIEASKKEIEANKKEIEASKKEIETSQRVIDAKNEELRAKDAEIEQLKRKLGITG